MYLYKTTLKNKKKTGKVLIKNLEKSADENLTILDGEWEVF